MKQTDIVYAVETAEDVLKSNMNVLLPVWLVHSSHFWFSLRFTTPPTFTSVITVSLNSSPILLFMCPLDEVCIKDIGNL